MSQPFDPTPGGMGGPIGRPDGSGLPPGTGGGLQPPDGRDVVDPGREGEGGDLGEDTGGLPGER